MKPTRTQPGVMIMRNGKLVVFSDENLHGPNWTVGPVELFGFGAGTLLVEQTSAAQGILPACPLYKSHQCICITMYIGLDAK